MPFELQPLADTATNIIIIHTHLCDFLDERAQPSTPRFQYRRAAFFNTLKSKTGLMVARAAALRTKINIDGRPLCSLPSPPSDLVQGVAGHD